MHILKYFSALINTVKDSTAPKISSSVFTRLSCLGNCSGNCATALCYCGRRQVPVHAEHWHAGILVFMRAVCGFRNLTQTKRYVGLQPQDFPTASPQNSQMMNSHTTVPRPLSDWTTCTTIWPTDILTTAHSWSLHSQEPWLTWIFRAEVVPRCLVTSLYVRMAQPTLLFGKIFMSLVNLHSWQFMMRKKFNQFCCWTLMMTHIYQTKISDASWKFLLLST